LGTFLKRIIFIYRVHSNYAKFLKLSGIYFFGVLAKLNAFSIRHCTVNLISQMAYSSEMAKTQDGPDDDDDDDDDDKEYINEKAPLPGMVILMTFR
jgi:hypothetical protein